MISVYKGKNIMVNLIKRILLVAIMALMLVPVVGFRQIVRIEPETVFSQSESGTIDITIDGTSSHSEEENLQSSSDELIVEQNLNKNTTVERVKTAYLTFDDGPSPLVTPKILEILKQHEIKATFFVIGKQAEQNPELIRQIWEEGHFICNHTYSHNYKLIYSSPDSFMAEVTKCEKVLKSILGENYNNKILRFPGGSFGKKRLPFRERVKEEGYISIDWNALNGDAEALNVPADKLLNRIKETTKNKNNAIVLMHDSNTKKTTAEALPDIINHLISEGYSFETLENYEF